MFVRRLLSAAFTAALSGATWVTGCGDDSGDGNAAGGQGGAQGDAAGDTGANLDASSSDGDGSPDTGVSPDSGPTPPAYDPCASAACWNVPTLGACGDKLIQENFASGNYNIHRALLLAPAGVEITLTATRTAGSWGPALIVHDEQGSTVFDSGTPYSSSALQVTAVSPAPGPDSLGVKLTASTRMHLSVFMTGANVVSSAFKDSLPADAKYTLHTSVACAPPGALTVNGVKLDSEQELWVRYIAREIVPKLPGTAAERVDKGAYVTWWSLKEGVLNVNNPLSYSNCSVPPDQHIGPLELCPDPKHAWQVGLSAVQATYNTLAGTEKLALSLFPGDTIEDILRDAAVTAGFGETTEQAKAITASTDRLRVSWLLRQSPVGFAAEYSPVYNQCFAGAPATWCFNFAPFAPNLAGAQKSVADLKAIFQSLAP
ncbi:MAG: hypothetical protein IPI67_25975 [Myxococcales bacterium]|nr:hypothetical protein [Myxococcales bacterium]